MAKTVTNISKLSPTDFVSNIRHQHLNSSEIFSAHLGDIEAMKGTDSRVLFQSADGKINMGVWFNDPDIEMYEIFWLNVIAREIDRYLYSSEGLITIDDELDIRSCYAELHRIGIDNF